MTETRDQQKAPANDNVAALVDNGSLDFVGSALNKRLLLKTDLLVLPLIVLTSTFAFLDKGIFGGILSYAIGKINGSLETWKYIFLIYGSVTMGYGILVFAALPDRPEKAWFFSAEEKKASIIRTADNQTEAKKHREWKTAHILEAVRDPKYWCVVVFTIAQSITNAGITNFNPLIISGYGFSQSKTTLMATPQAAVALVAQVFCTTLAFFIPNIRCVLWVLGTLPALAGAVMIHVLDVQAARSASLAGVYLMGFYNVAWVLMLSLQSSNTAGETKKSFCSVSVAVFYAVGNIVGPQFFRESQTTGVLYGLLCVVENRRRDSLYGRPVTALEDPSLSTEAEDRTDFENTNFRYVY
ncbi:putative allantoate permease protein [Neofusicoccum parvum UCRNP2]|uniref:Putative allantoate permease protein n=1 Tax=Botryosphaeria parva (strain UCR-NP2) TaxID=1287680 RepID=R1EDF7_BOTPV|nr:putative allantoate permease protein [Neofusicoccum parvum UCRNP2]